MRAHFRFAGVLPDEVLANVGALIGRWSACNDLTGHASSMCASRHARVLGSRWVYHRSDDSFVGRTLRSVLRLQAAIGPEAPRNLASLSTGFAHAIDLGAAFASQKVGRLVRWAWAYRSISVRDPAVQSRLSRWPSTILVDTSLSVMHRTGISLHAKWSALRRLLGGNRAALRWTVSEIAMSAMHCSSPI